MTQLDRPSSGARCLLFTGQDAARELEDKSQISDILENRENFVWLDLALPTHEELALLQEEFKLHPLAIEDATALHERPKIEAYDGFWLAIVHAVTLEPGRKLVTHEIAIFAGDNFVVTIRSAPPWPIAEIERRWQSHWGTVPRDSTGLLYTILDTVVDGYQPVATALDDQIVDLETHLFEPNSQRRESLILRRIFNLKRDLSTFRRAVSPVREMLQPVLRGDVKPLSANMLAYFRDVYDHVLRVLETIDSARDLVNGTLDIHLSSMAHKQSEASKQLTIIATIFLPLTYITGFFGQNFAWMVGGITSPQIFWILGVGGQLVALAGLLAFFRYKRWF